MTDQFQQEIPATAELCLPQRLQKPRLRRKDVPEYLDIKFGIPIAVKTLERMVTTGGGPAYQKINNTPLYPTVELDVWAEKVLGKAACSSAEHDAAITE